MSKNEVVVKYIPAGMKIKIDNETEHPKKQNLKPPKVICKNRKSLNLENLNVEFHENKNCDRSNSSQNLVEDDGKTHASGTSTQNKITNIPTETPTNFKTIVEERLKRLKQKKQSLPETCACDNCDSFINCSAWCSNNTTFQEPNQSTKKIPFLNTTCSVKQQSVIKLFNKLILHGSFIPKPVFSLDQTFIDDSIQSKLNSLNCSSTKDVQSYMWPAVQRGLSVFMIAPPKSGKTLSYLPVFGTFCLEKDERYSDLMKYSGPLIVVLCHSLEACNELLMVAKMLLGGVMVEVLTGDSYVNTCDIIITTPTTLECSLKSGSMSLRRLCHIAIEDAHLVLKKHSTSTANFLRVVDLVQTKRPQHKSIQIVVGSEKWSTDLEILVKKLHTPPVVCFDDFLEAAVYSKIDFKRKKLKSAHKVFYLDDVLKTNFMIHKTVIFCNGDDVEKIKEHLEICGIECIALSGSLIEDEFFENEDMWESLQCGHYKVLLSTDSSFEKARNIQSAHWIVHYSLPPTWTQFQKRFRCLSRNLRSPLDVDSSNLSMCSFLVMDDLSDDSLFLDFFEVLARNAIAYLHL